MTISIKDYTSTALSVEAGKKLRELILSQSDTDDEIVLDFEGISLFATMYFNASIGYLVKEKHTDLIDRIKLQNLSDLGKRTYLHSIQNAKSILDEENESIARTTIDES